MEDFILAIIIFVGLPLILYLISPKDEHSKKEYERTLMVRKYGKAGEGNVFTDMDSAYNKVYEKDINKRES